MANIAYENLFTPGTELPEFKFHGFLDWFVKYSDIRVHWKYEPTYLLAQFAYIFGGIATLTHAIINGGRLPYLWVATLLHGVAVESISYIHPDVDNFWHSQTPLMFLGRRLPFHIILLYPCFIYTASIAVAKMRLPKWSEPFAVALLVVLIDIPYDIVSVNFLHWVWHDTDPNIGDRHYWVPWNSYYFHSTFAASFTFWFHYSRKLICKSKGKWFADTSCFKEWICTFITALLGAPGGILLFLPIYHPLHDLFNVHSEVSYFVIFAVFLLLIWTGDRRARRLDATEPIPYKTHWTSWLSIVHLVLHYGTFLAMVLFFRPEDEISTGLKEPLGKCDEYSTVNTVFGVPLRKRKYLCATDYDEQYYDWSCLPKGKPPADGSVWYTTCGVPLSNKVEFVTIISLLTLIATVVFGNLHFGSCGDGVFKEKDVETRTQNMQIKKKKH